MLFDNWPNIYRTLIVGVLAYAALIFLLRVTGKRTLSKWNAFDFVVTIALGSTLASALVTQTTTLAQGVFAFGLLVVLQFLITWLSVRFAAVRRWIKGHPTLLLHHGQLLNEALKAERVTEGEVRAAIRSRGLASLEQVEAVVLETDGSFSVIANIPIQEASALTDVAGYIPSTSQA